MKKRTEITIETARLLIIDKPLRMIGWCAQCGKETNWLAIDDAARLVGQSTRAIFRLVERADLHAGETPEGILTICGDSLIQVTRAITPTTL